MERILGLDIGEKRIGVAISDPLGIIASELELVLRKTDKAAIERIIELARSNGVKIIVAGVPYDNNDDATIGPQAQKCIDFANAINAAAKVSGEEFKIEFWDETLSSFAAEELLKKEKKRYTKDKGLVDLKSACLILGEYLQYGRKK